MPRVWTVLGVALAAALVAAATPPSSSSASASASASAAHPQQLQQQQWRGGAMSRDAHAHTVSALLNGGAPEHVHAQSRTIHLRNGVVDVAHVLDATPSDDAHHGASKSFLFAAAPTHATRRVAGVPARPLKAPHHATANLAAKATVDLLDRAHAAGPSSAYTTYVVHFKGPLTDRARQVINEYLANPAVRAACTARGDAADEFALALGAYVPHNTHFVTGASDAPGCERVLRDAPFALFVDELHAEFKLDERLLPAPQGVSPRLLRLQKEAVTDAPAGSAPAKPKTTSQARPQYVVHLAHSRHALRDGDLTQWVSALNSNAVVRDTRVTVQRYGSSNDAGVVDRVLVSLTAGDGATDADRRAVLSWLAQRTEVLFVEPRTTHSTQNRYALYTVQSDQYGNDTISGGHGLTGQGQIVSVGDTGADVDGCFFSDPAVSVAVRPAPPNFNHRKVVYYDPVLNGNSDGGDTGDDAAGHGTHVAGSIAGAAYRPTANSGDVAWLAQYNGMATGAKLAIFDFKIVGKPDLNVPDAIVDGYYSNAYSIAQSRINSNSWGSEDGAYDYYCIETDRFVWEHPDFLPLFAAGNYGEGGYYTLSSPGVAKNVLTVGATLSSSESWRALGRLLGLSILSGPSTLTTPMEIAGAQFGLPLVDADLPASLPLVLADPELGCTAAESGTTDPLPLTNAAAVSGKAVLIKRGTCSFQWKATAAQRAGALLVVIYDDQAGALFPLGPPDAATGGAVTVLITLANGQPLANALKAGSSIVLSGEPVPLASVTLNSRSMATFSSRGPTPDGRVKPDVSAPGSMVVSARSDGDAASNQCIKGMNIGVVQMEGTSMATPVTAGTASLVRQYYTEGYYPSGVATPANAMLPSAALLKATLIASTAPQVYLGEGTATSRPRVAPPPGVEQGFGRVLLESALVMTGPPVAGEPDTPNLRNHNLWVQDVNNASANAAVTGSLTSFCFRATPTPLSGPDNPLCTGLLVGVPCYRPFKATLVWSDPPASSQSMVALINNLDLSVVGTARAWLGNEFTYDDPNNHGHPVPQWDVLNNVEQVTLNGNDPQFVSGAAFYTVSVRGTNVPLGPQGYALVVTGNFEARPLADCQSANGPGLVCPNACSNNGNCSALTGVCSCAGDYTGADCSQLSVRLTRDTDNMDDVTFLGQGEAASNAWTYFAFDLAPTELDRDLQVTLTRTSSVGDPDLYLAFGRYPTQASFLGAATACDTCRGATGVSSFVVAANTLQAGTYRIGVHAYCCADAAFNVQVTTHFGDETDHAPAGTVLWIALLVTLAVIATAMGGVWLYRRYKQRNGGGSAAEDIPAWARGGGHRLGGGGDAGVGHHAAGGRLGVVPPPPPVHMSGPGYRLGGGGEVMVPQQPQFQAGGGGGGYPGSGNVVVGPSGPMSLVPPRSTPLSDDQSYDNN